MIWANFGSHLKPKIDDEDVSWGGRHAHLSQGGAILKQGGCHPQTGGAPSPKWGAPSPKWGAPSPKWGAPSPCGTPPGKSRFSEWFRLRKQKVATTRHIRAGTVADFTVNLLYLVLDHYITVSYPNLTVTLPLLYFTVT